MKTALIVAAMFAVATCLAQDMAIDPAQSRVIWHASKVTGKHHGQVTVENGTLRMEDGGMVMAEVTMDMHTITCEDITSESSNAKLVGHLKSADFFNVEEHHKAHFRMTSIVPEADGYRVTGDLTIKGITHPNTFLVKAVRNAFGLVATGTLEFDRAKYDVRYGSGSFFDDLGDRTIHDEVRLDLHIVAR